MKNLPQNTLSTEDHRAIFPVLLEQLEARVFVSLEQAERLEHLADLVVGTEPECPTEVGLAQPIDCFRARFEELLAKLENAQNHINRQIARLEEF